MFTINNKADYALILISSLIDQNGFIPLSELVHNVHLPPRFLARIASELVKHDILQSREGKVGGYKLIRDLKKVTLFEFLNIFNKETNIVKCQKVRFNCLYGEVCNHKSFFKTTLNNIFLSELKKWTLEDLLKV